MKMTKKELENFIKEEVLKYLSDKYVLESNFQNIENKIGKNKAIRLYEKRVKWLQENK